MASYEWNPHGVSMNVTATASSINRISATQFTAVITASWESQAGTNFGMKVDSGGKTIYIPKFNGDSWNRSGSGTLNGTYSISGNGSQTVSIGVTFTNYKDDDGKPTASRTEYVSVSVPAWTSYTVSYNANGGSGAPSSQTKWKDQTLTLSSTKPTRTGYTFSKWNTKSDGSGTSYNAGSNYTANSGATLYAIWTPYTHTISYNANGGSNAPSNQTKKYGSTIDITSSKPTRIGYTFLYWNTESNGNGTTYNSGQTYGYDQNGGTVVLYAIWSENALTVNYYRNSGTYASFKGAEVTTDLVHSQQFYYDGVASSGLADVQNAEYVYISRTGYTPTGYWGTSTTGGTLINQSTTYNTGQALAQALGKDLSSGNASINLYPQWQINTYTIGYDGNGGYGSMDVQSVDWQETFILLDNKFKREGYKFVGWNAQREIDRKWYVNGQGWLTEDEITSNGYEKKLYLNQDELIFDLSWIIDETEVIHQYTMYAVWEISGVVYIDNGTTFEPYLAYIDNGTDWELYLMYVDDGLNWNIIS